MSGGGGSVGEDVARQSVAGEMIMRKNAPGLPPTVVDRVPEPDERPDRRAQWDEVTGEWIVWDEDDEAWEDVEHTASEGG